MKESPAVARSHGAVADPGVHTRCVITAMEPARTTVLARPMSWARGQAENAIKEPNLDLTAERTSWQRFEAYQVRLWWHSAASVFRTTPWAAAPRETIP